MELNPPEEKWMKNDERDENPPVEMIEGRLKTSVRMKIDARKRLRLQEEEGRRRENKGNLEGGTNEYLEEKTPVEIIEERKQRLRTSRKDTRLQTPVPRRKEVGGREKKQGQLRTRKTTSEEK